MPHVDWLKIILEVLNWGSVVIVILTTIYAVFLWAKGVTPALVRLGNGLTKRKIAIFAKQDSLSSLKSLLLDSGLFSQKNIIEITASRDFGKAEKATLYLVNWPDWKTEAIQILNQKKDPESYILYAPKEAGYVQDSDLALMDKKRNFILVNFRGRLLNDIVASIITTSYDKKRD